MRVLRSLEGADDSGLSLRLAAPERLAVVKSLGIDNGIPEERFDRWTRLCAMALRVPLTVVTVVGAEDLYIKSAVGMENKGEAVPLVDTICQYVVASGVPVMIADLAGEISLRAMVSRPGFRAYAGVPLLSRGHVVGTLCAMDTQARCWTEIERETLLELAGVISEQLTPSEHAQSRVAEAERRLATALVEQQRALEQHRETVHKLTLSFLGRAPHLPGWDIATHYQAAHEADHIGGDFYDFLRLGPTHLGLVIGDVCGKGMAAAVHTANIVCLLRYYSRECTDPVRLMKRLNEALLQQLVDEGIFITLFLGILDRRSGALLYCNAGHPAPILCPPDTSDPQSLRTTGPVLGVMENATFGEACIRIPVGGGLVLFTDGITEATHSLEALSPMMALRNAHRLPSRRIVYNVMELARQACRGQLQDDAAVVVLRRLRSHSRLPDAQLEPRLPQ